MTLKGSAGVPKGREADGPLPAAPAGAAPPRAAVSHGSPSTIGVEAGTPAVHKLIRDHRRLAYRLAHAVYLPGADRDDVDQEALIALWEAARAYDGSTAFATFATVVIRRRLHDAMKLANRGKHKPLTLAARHAVNDDGDLCPIIDLVGTTVTEPHRVAAARETLTAVCAASATLTDLEREALRRSVNGIPYANDKQLDNAHQRAIAKLRKAAA